MHLFTYPATPAPCLIPAPTLSIRRDYLGALGEQAPEQSLSVFDRVYLHELIPRTDADLRPL